MKKLIAIMLCALVALLPALAEEFEFELPFVDELPEQPNQSAEPERDAAAGDTFAIDYHGQTISMDFDPSAQGSYIADGLVQASFSKNDGDILYKLYVVFSASAAPGTEITPDYAAMDRPETSVVLIVSDTKTMQEQYYMASLMDGAPYPSGSDFTICIDEIHDVNGKVDYVGRLSGTLIALDMATGAVTDTLTIPETPFAFTFGAGAGAAPVPTPTAASDMRKV